jgi:AraC family transcriptional regulator, regulatory protein of adaptative response / DNA-3-methyladenine glycosylase II
VHLDLAARPPFDGAGVLAWAALHAVPSRDVVDEASWTRTLDGPTVRMRPGVDRIDIEVGPTADRRAAASLARHVFDADADPQAIGEVLSADPALAPLVAARPGMRIPAAADAYEGAVRVVIGQQVSAKGATTLMGRLAALTDAPGLPDPAQVAAAPLESLIGLTRQRAGAVRALAALIADDEIDLTPQGDPDVARERLVALPGIGPWTAATTVLLVMRQPDAWPTGDLVLRQVVSRLTGRAIDARELDGIAERWRPWRGYAAMHLWHAHLDGRV